MKMLLAIKPHIEPTEAQKEAGNYLKRKVEWRGLSISIENEAGSFRRGTSPDGEPWETMIFWPYGYIRRTMGVDGDQVDVYLGQNLEECTHVYVVHQRRYGDWAEYDEDKCMIGFDSDADAAAAFLSCYDDDRFLGPITAIPVDEFVRKAKATLAAPAMIKSMPNAGDRIEFLSDRFTDKGPATGVIEDWKTTVDGNMITVQFGDEQESFSWDDLAGRAEQSPGGLWVIKSTAGADA